MKINKEQRILGVRIEAYSSKYILEKIIKGLRLHKNFLHVVSLNPEILVLASKDSYFKRIIDEADISINDGIGIVLASQMINGVFVPRLTGVDLMQNILKETSEESFRVLLLGGKPNLAESIADCYNQSYPSSKFKGIVGFNDIKAPLLEEQKEVFSIVTAMKPHLIFVAFGSPEQEMWIYRNRRLLQGITCIGVGGAFDFIGGNVKRAPKIVRTFGAEWFYRLLLQPWRWRRQLQLFVFMWLVLKQKFSNKN